MMKLTYLGHSAFEIETNGAKILLDPFLEANPAYRAQGITDILLSHGHADHLGSAVEIAVQNNATITAVFELAQYCANRGAKVNPMNLGGWLNYAWGRVLPVQAAHSSSTPDGAYAGCACGYMIQIAQTRLYYAGDTALMPQMKFFAKTYRPDIAILPVGGQFTMDISQACIAAHDLGVKACIPMHYNTFEAIRADMDEFTQMMQAMKIEPLVMPIGGYLQF